jgi:hypothetical protein
MAEQKGRALLRALNGVDMSVDVGFFLNLVSTTNAEMILDALLASRWLGHSDGWWCVPVGEDSSEWNLVASNNIEDVKLLFRTKMRVQEVFGIRLWWEGGAVGGEFLILPNCEVVFSPTMNRVTLGQRVTDVSWYLERVLPIFVREGGVVLDSWTWRETS